MKTTQQVLMALDEWLETKGLTIGESIMIRTLRNAVKSAGLDEFGTCARHLYQMMPDTVKSAINKARAQGRCQEWPRIA